MRKIFAGIVLAIVIIGTVLVTGCTSTEKEDIEGSIHNEADFRVSVDFSAVGVITEGVWIPANTTQLQTLQKPNNYAITVKDYDGNVIERETLELDEDSSSFKIVIDADSVLVAVY